jgi:hypothetical protein
METKAAEIEAINAWKSEEIAAQKTQLFEIVFSIDEIMVGVEEWSEA